MFKPLAVKWLSGSMHESPGHLSPKGLRPQRHAFLFQPGDTEKYVAPEKLSPEVLALGEHVAQGNPLRRKQFHDEDRRWTHVSSLARSSMRLAAYAGGCSSTHCCCPYRNSCGSSLRGPPCTQRAAAET